MTVKDYKTAAQKAHDTLTPLLDDAFAEAQAMLEKAGQVASRDAVRPELVEMINKADTPPADAIAGILASYAGLLPQHLARDGGLFIRSLVSIKKHHGLTDSQAAQIAGAIVASIHGKAPMSLIEWPGCDDWDSQLHHTDLDQWAAWVSPKEHGKLTSKLEAETKARINAESVLVHLEASRRALADLVPKVVTTSVIKIRNNSEHRQGISGVRWTAGEVKALDAVEYAAVTDSAGYQSLIESGQLEVVA